MFCVVKKVRGGGTIELRLVFNLPEVNDLFREPPWSALGGPGAFASVDTSVEGKKGWFLAAAGGDVPIFFYKLGITEALS